MAWTEQRSKLNDDDSAALLVYGHGSAGLAELLAAYSTISCVATNDWEDLVNLLGARPFIGISAMSNTDRPGEAGQAIGLFRREYGDTEVALYNAWDYNVRRATLRALEYGADGIIMPGIDTADLFGCVLGYLERVANSAMRPGTPEEHEAILRTFTKRSPFWTLQDRVVSPYF
jgi:hypothetical protein